MDSRELAATKPGGAKKGEPRNFKLYCSWNNKGFVTYSYKSNTYIKVSNNCFKNVKSLQNI